MIAASPLFKEVFRNLLGRPLLISVEVRSVFPSGFANAASAVSWLFPRGRSGGQTGSAPAIIRLTGEITFYVRYRGIDSI